MFNNWLLKSSTNLFPVGHWKMKARNNREWMRNKQNVCLRHDTHRIIFLWGDFSNVWSSFISWITTKKKIRTIYCKRISKRDCFPSRCFSYPFWLNHWDRDKLCTIITLLKILEHFFCCFFFMFLFQFGPLTLTFDMEMEKIDLLFATGIIFTKMVSFLFL